MQNQAKGTAWPKERRLIGTKIPRQDGPEKSTGTAKYSFDINRPGMLHGMILRCPLAHAQLESVDTSAAEKMPGVKAIHPIAAPGKELYYAGDEILGLAADTEEHARDALRAIVLKLKPLKFFVQEQDVLENPNVKTVGGGGNSNVTVGQEFTRGDVAEAYKKADAIVEAEYGVATICHQCLESHGLVAEWGGPDTLTVWCSVQATRNVAKDLATHFKIPETGVKCITHHMGGGYGSKFNADIQGIVCAELAKKAGAPVKLMLNREEEITVGGNRPSAYGKVKIAGTKDGTITAFEVDCYGTPGETGAATVNLGLLPYVYVDIPNIKRKHSVARTNAGKARAMRAPGHPQNCILTDQPVDDLAAKLGLDPMQVRLKNIPPNDAQAAKDNPLAWLGQRHTVYTKQIQLAAELSKWKEKWHPPGKGPSKGPVKHGIGMALHTWGGGAVGNDQMGNPINELTIVIGRDGSITALGSTQDLGTGQRTVSAIVTAEIFGMEPKDIIVRIGDSSLGSSSGSGGSTTCPSQAPAALRAALGARDSLFSMIAPKLGAKPEDLRIEKGGKVVDGASGKSWPWKEACAKLGMGEVRVKEGWSSVMANEPTNPGVSNVQVGGVQVAEVWVDTETGVVRCTDFVAVQDSGLIINQLCWESQVTGGVIMGVNYALLEERIMDRHTGRQVNPDMEFYKLGGIQDMPRITVKLFEMPERGVIGIGEPPTVSTAAAVGNAVFNAIGIRVPHAPFTPARVLAALSKGGKA